jgi:hypothetical protein
MGAVQNPETQNPECQNPECQNPEIQNPEWYEIPNGTKSRISKSRNPKYRIYFKFLMCISHDLLEIIKIFF